MHYKEQIEWQIEMEVSSQGIGLPRTRVRLNSSTVQLSWDTR